MPRIQDVTVTVAHWTRVGRPADERVGMTLCLLSHPSRCTGGRAVLEAPAQRLPNPVTAALGFGDEMIPVDTPVPVYVHVVLKTGSSWQPAPDLAVSRREDPNVLDVDTVTRRIAILEQ